MKITRAGFLDRYRHSLRAHLNGRKTMSVFAADKLGRAALAGGLAPTDLALVHDKTVLPFLDVRDAEAQKHLVKRAGLFLQGALAPFEAARRASLQANRELEQRNAILRAQTVALARGYRQLGREKLRGETAQVNSRGGTDRYRRLLRESQGRQKKLHQLTRQILSMQESERKKISRELHDKVVQTLVGINVELTALGSGTGWATQTLKRKIAHTQRIVESSVKAVHRFARDLRPTVLDDLGLIPALHAFSKNLATQQRLRIELTAFAGVETLNITKRTVLFRVAEEALNNVARHAKATRVTLGITERKNAIVMEIADNGKSVGGAHTLLGKSTRQLGMIQMRERIEMIGGTLAIEASPERGTTIRTEIPFNAESP